MIAPELLLDAPHEVMAWVYARLDRPPLSGGYQAVGVTRRGRIVGGFVFHNMQENRGSIELSIAGVGAFVTDEVIKFLCWNAFESIQAAHVAARTSAKNIRAQRALQRVGFRIEGTQRKAWDGETDAVLLGFTRDDAARWLGNRKEKTHGWR